MRTERIAVFTLIASLLLTWGCDEKDQPAKVPPKAPDAVQAKAPDAPRAAPEAPLPTPPAGMVLVAAGPFWRGCKPEVDGECTEPEKPGRELSLGHFFIDRTEVTVGGYKACVDAGACKTDDLATPVFEGKPQPDWAWACNWGKADRAGHPVNCVAWEQAAAYCKWAGKRLPSEAEWEKAARGKDGRKYAWGNMEYAELARNALRMGNIADEAEKRRDPEWTVAAGYDDGFAGTAPVGSFPAGASPAGALDMTGNVLEWVADWYDPGYYEKAPAADPPGPSAGELRVARGGAWYGEPDTTRIGLRWPNPTRRIVAVGFRCAMTPPASK